MSARTGESFAKINCCVRNESSFAYFSFKKSTVRIFKGLFQNHLKARFGTQFQRITIIKKHGVSRVFFVCIISWGCPPQTPTQRTFREKSFGNSKAFAKINRCGRDESSFAYFSFKKSMVAYLSFKKGKEKMTEIL